MWHDHFSVGGPILRPFEGVITSPPTSLDSGRLNDLIADHRASCSSIAARRVGAARPRCRSPSSRTRSPPSSSRRCRYAVGPRPRMLLAAFPLAALARGPVADTRVQHRARHIRRPARRADVRDHHDPRRGAVTVLADAARQPAATRSSRTATDTPSRPAACRRAAGSVIAVVAGGFILMYVVVALLRLRYPYELEWIEGGMVNHVAQLRTGQSAVRRSVVELHA